MIEKLSYERARQRTVYRLRLDRPAEIRARRRRSLGFAAAVLASVTLAACGGSSGHHAQGSATSTGGAGDPAPEPNAVIVRVGPHVITYAAFAHALAGLEHFEGLTAATIPVPPDFTACIAHLRAGAASSSGTGSTPPSTTALRSQCEQQRHSLVKAALDPLISQQWVIGGAAEENVGVSAQQLAAALRKAQGKRSRAQVERQLASDGETFSDFVQETRTNLLAEAIRRRIAGSTERLTRAQVLSYYNAHRSSFGLPPRRAVEIARAGSESEALTIKSELASGKSFASVVAQLPVQQPIFTKEGLIAAYEPNLYREPRLNNAIFAAKPNVLTGPVSIYLGYYVFEVKRELGAVPEPFSQAQAKIRQMLPNELYQRALVAFVGKWRTRWKALTSCQPAYVVQKCSSAPAVAEDANTLA
jgi:hypothetical protein